MLDWIRRVGWGGASKTKNQDQDQDQDELDRHKRVMAVTEAYVSCKSGQRSTSQTRRQEAAVVLWRGQRLKTKRKAHSGVQNRPWTLVFVVIKLPSVWSLLATKRTGRVQGGREFRSRRVSV